MIRILTVLLLVVPVASYAQDKSPDEAYRERIDQARAEYRVAISNQIRRAKLVEVVLLRFDDLMEDQVFEDRLLQDDLSEDDLSRVRFFIAPYEATTSVISEKKLNATESKELLFELANQIAKPAHEGGAFCHFPIHGVRVYSDKPSGEPFGDKLIYSGSFCWVCRNFGFTYPDGAEWLDTNDRLKTIFSKLLPVPKEEIERFEKEHPTKQTRSQPGDPERSSTERRH